MTLVPSTRLRNHVVFHCPACGDDRVGRRRRGIWTRWPSTDEQFGSYLECVACRAQTGHGIRSSSPVGTSFASRLNTAVYASAALITRSAPGDEALLRAAQEFIARFSTTEVSADQLLRRAQEPRLVVDVCGSLTLLNEDLSDQARRSLINALVDLAQIADRALPLEAAEFCVLFLLDDSEAPALARR